MNINDVHVKISEARTGNRGDRLRAVLGSCIGIAFIWKERGICGLAHCLLPETKEHQTLSGAKYVNQAILTLISLMKIQSENVHEIEVHIAGGGNMMAQLSRHNVDDIGKMNIQAARKYLMQSGFKISTEDVGGILGRQIYLDCSEGSVRIDTIERTN